jgi:hypothetical protein
MSGGTGFQVETIQFGQEVRDVDGSLTIATADLVQVSLIADGKALASGLCTPDQAHELTAQITAAARKLQPEPAAPRTTPAYRLGKALGQSFGGLL